VSGRTKTAKEWDISHKYALAVNQRVLPYISSLIKQRRKDARGIGDYFMDEAKVFLNQKEFEAIL
jgi:hypothetical protein